MRFEVMGGKIVGITVECNGGGKVKLPVRPDGIDISYMSRVEDLINQLADIGVFRGGLQDEKFRAVISRMTSREKTIIRKLRVDGWVTIDELASSIGATDTRAIAGLLAQITRKLRDQGLLGEDERFYEQEVDLTTRKLQYKLRPEFSVLKELLERD